MKKGKREENNYTIINECVVQPLHFTEMNCNPKLNVRNVSENRIEFAYVRVVQRNETKNNLWCLELNSIFK